MKVELARQAQIARDKAYAPYSGYCVGAAACNPQGEIFTGANVENVSYGLTLCAERIAISRMVTSGYRELAAIAIATQDGGTPCGMCLQTMLEFAPDPTRVRVFCVNTIGEMQIHLLKDLIPYGFSSPSLKRTEPNGSGVI